MEDGALRRVGNLTLSATVELRSAAKSVRLPSGDRLELFSDLSLDLRAGESLAITGRSGSGKSTLLRALGLFTPFDAGEHRLLGTDVRSAGDRQCSRLRARSIGFVFQDFRLLPALSAAENIDYGATLAGLGRRRRRRAVADALERVGLSDRARSRPGILSGGEQQRVAIARALVKDPALVLADEPTGALDGETAGRVMDLLMDVVRRASSSLIVVTHDEQVASLCDRRLQLGRPAADTPADPL